MKISLKLLIVMFLSFSILLTSCSTNENKIIETEPQIEEVPKEEEAETSEDLVEIVAEDEEDIELGELI